MPHKNLRFTAAKTQCWQRYIRVPQQQPLTASKVSKRGPLEPIGTPECCLVAYFSQTNLRISQLNLKPFQDGNACHAIFATFSSQHYAACFSNLLQISNPHGESRSTPWPVAIHSSSFQVAHVVDKQRKKPSTLLEARHKTS